MLLPQLGDGALARVGRRVVVQVLHCLSHRRVGRGGDRAREGGLVVRVVHDGDGSGGGGGGVEIVVVLVVLRGHKWWVLPASCLVCALCALALLAPLLVLFGVVVEMG